MDSESLVKSSSPVLRDAYEQLAKESKRTTLMDLILPSDKDEKNDGAEHLSDDELITRFELQRLISKGAYREAVEKWKLALQSVTKPSLREDIFKLIIKAHRLADELREAVSVSDDLIQEQPYSASHYLLKADLLNRHQDKLDAINKAIEVNPHWYRGYYRKAYILFSSLSKRYGKDKDDVVNEALQAVEKGLEKDPSLDNPCWETKFNLVEELEKNKPAKEAGQKNIIDSLNNMNPESLLVLRLRMSMLSEEKDQSTIKLQIEEINNLKKKKPLSVHSAFDEVKFKGLMKLVDAKQITKEIDDAMSAYDLASEPDLVVAIARLMRNKLGKDNEAIELLQRCYHAGPFDQDIVDSLLDVLVDMGRVADAEAIFNKVRMLMLPSSVFDFKLKLFEAKNDFDGGLNEIDKRAVLTGMQEHGFKAYFLIKNNKSKEAESYLRGFLESINFSPEAAVEIVNYELACKKQRGKVDQGRLDKVKSFDATDQMLAVIYSLLGKKHEMIEHLKKAVMKNRTFQFDAKRWPVFDSYRADADFIKAISLPLNN